MFVEADITVTSASVMLKLNSEQKRELRQKSILTGFLPSSASSFILFFYRYWYSYIVYSVSDSASEFGAMGSTSFLGFSYPNLLLVFLNLLFLGTCIIFSRKCWDFLWVFFIFIVIFLYLILG